MSTALAIVFSSQTISATPAQAAAPADVRTFVTLHINTVDDGETVAILRGSDVLVPISAFEQAGVHGLEGARETIHNEIYVSLMSLAPDVTFKLDPDSLSLDVTISAKHFGGTSQSLTRARPRNIDYTSTSSAYTNYAVTDAGGASNGYFETGISHGQDSFHFSFTASSDSAVRRGLIYDEMDDRLAEVRKVAGDFDAASGDLGGSIFMAGIGAARAFDLDPYAIHYPLPSLSGVATTPSIANVYVNGQLVQQVDLPPGSFNLNQLPVTTGSGNATVVVTDALGNSHTYAQSYYATPEILAPGTTDYQYAVGLLRRNEFSYGDSYGPGAAVARYVVGLTNALTLGGRFEATPYLVSAGPVFDWSSSFGSFHFAASGSDQQGLSGVAASFGYAYNAPRFNMAFTFLAQGPYYANVSQAPDLDRATSSVSAFAGTPVGVTSLGAQYSRRHMRDSGTFNQLTVIETFPVSRGYSFGLSLQRNTSTTSAPSDGVTGTLNFAVGRASGSVTEQVGTTSQANVEVQQSPQGRYGLGYAASYNPSFHALSGSLGYQSQYGNGELDYATSSVGSLGLAARVAGGVAFIDGGTYLSQPITSSYALVDVPGIPGVGVYLENEFVGNTDKNGKLLVTDLLPNYGNPIRIDDKNVPLNTSIQTVEKLVAPPSSAGAVVTFAATHLLALTGSVVVEAKGQTIVPKFGELDLTGKEFHTESALGANGEFYLENVPAGTYPARVLYEGGECAFEFSAPQTEKILVKMGTLRCTQQ